MKVVINYFDKESQIQKSIKREIKGEYTAFNAAKKAMQQTKFFNYTLQVGDYMTPTCFRFVANSPDGKNSIQIYTYKE